MRNNLILGFMKK